MIHNLKEKLDALRAEQQTAPRPDPPPAQPASDLCHFERFTYPWEGHMAAARTADGDLLSCLMQTPLPEAFRPERVLYLDTETTGLSTGTGTLAFLVGIGYFEGNRYVIEQYLMEDYDQEPDLLNRLLETLSRFDTLVTYNGKSFDVPLLEVRYVMNRLHGHLRQMTQLDLLHAARRLYKMRLGSCSLGNMERMLLDIQRQGDIPGAEIPEVFFAYVKDRDPIRMDTVLSHNRQDIRSMPLLLGLMLETMGRVNAGFPEDTYSCGRLYLRSGRGEEAERRFREALPLSEARAELALYCRRQGRWAEAAALWEDMIRDKQGGTAPYHALAKYEEHVLHDPAAAYRRMEGLRTSLGQWGIHDPEVEKRFRRLQKYQKKEIDPCL